MPIFSIRYLDVKGVEGQTLLSVATMEEAIAYLITTRRFPLGISAGDHLSGPVETIGEPPAEPKSAGVFESFMKLDALLLRAAESSDIAARVIADAKALQEEIDRESTAGWSVWDTAAENEYRTLLHWIILTPTPEALQQKIVDLRSRNETFLSRLKHQDKEALKKLDIVPLAKGGVLLQDRWLDGLLGLRLAPPFSGIVILENHPDTTAVTVLAELKGIRDLHVSGLFRHRLTIGTGAGAITVKFRKRLTSKQRNRASNLRRLILMHHAQGDDQLSTSVLSMLYAVGTRPASDDSAA